MTLKVQSVLLSYSVPVGWLLGGSLSLVFPSCFLGSRCHAVITIRCFVSVTSFSDVGEWEEVLGPRISGQVPTPARHLPGPPLRFPTPFYLGWGGVCRWGGVATRDGLGVLDPDALCPQYRMPVWVWAACS